MTRSVPVETPALLISSVTSGAACAAARDLGGVGDVERERDDPVEVDRARVAGGGVDLGRAALEQLLREVAADAAVGAGDQRGGAFDVHARARV